MPQPKTSYCGIDVGLKNHKACLLTEKQEIVRQLTIMNNRQGLEALEKLLSPTTKICLEPTGIYSINVFLYFKNRGYDIRFCTTNSSRDFRESLYGKKKHDNLDALSLAKYRIVHEPQTFNTTPFLERLSQDTPTNNKNLIQLDTLVAEYRRLFRQARVLQTKITGLVDLRFPEAGQVFTKNRGGPTIQNLLCHAKKDILEGKIKTKKLSQLQALLNDSIGQYEWMKDTFQEMATELKKNRTQAKSLEKQMKLEIEKHDYARLLNQPGISVINLATILIEVRDVNRFIKKNIDGTISKKRSIRAFKEFCGLSTTSNQSGQHEGGHKLQRKGNPAIRTILFMMALSYLSKPKYKHTSNPEGLSPAKYLQIYNEKTKSKPKKVCLFKMMSKIATDLYFLLLKQSQNTSTPSRHQAMPYKAPTLYATPHSRNAVQESS